jgi:hypothetical protein
MVFEFSDCEIHCERRQLRRHGADIDVEPQVFDVLVHLVRHRDRVVSDVFENPASRKAVSAVLPQVRPPLAKRLRRRHQELTRKLAHWVPPRSHGGASANSHTPHCRYLRKPSTTIRLLPRASTIEYTSVR